MVQASALHDSRERLSNTMRDLRRRIIDCDTLLEEAIEDEDGELVERLREKMLELRSHQVFVMIAMRLCGARE